MARNISESSHAILLPPTIPRDGGRYDYNETIKSITPHNIDDLQINSHYKAFNRWLDKEFPSQPADGFSFATAIYLNPIEPPLQLSPQTASASTAGPPETDTRVKRTLQTLQAPEDVTHGPNIDANQSHILFLRGYPSPKWINAVGSKYKVDPEFWRRHDMPVCSSKEVYDLPTLPSFCQCMVQLRVCSMFELRGNNLLIRKNLVRLRGEKGDANMSDYVNQVYKDSVVGASLVRGLHAIDYKILTVEQKISCTLVTHNGGWAVVVLLDIGRQLPASLISVANGGVSSSSSGGKGTGSASPSAALNQNSLRDRLTVTHRCIPVILPTTTTAFELSSSSPPPPPPPPPRTSVVSSAAPAAEPPPPSSGSGRRFGGALAGSPIAAQPYGLLSSQITANLPLRYGQGLDATCMRACPLYAASDVFRHVACSSNQWVNMLYMQVQQALRVHHPDDGGANGRSGSNRSGGGGGFGDRGRGEHRRSATDDSQDEADTLVDLQYIKDLLDEHAAYVADLVVFFESGCPAWMRPRDPMPESSVTTTLATTTLAELLDDFRCLLHRLERLSARCKDGTEILLSRAQLRESQTAIQKAREVGALTRLVFIFAPMSFLTSIFGMNFVQVEPNVGLPVYLVVTIVVASVMGLLTFQSVRNWLWRRWRRLMG